MPATKKKKSTVNKAGNYTKPTMRKNLFNKIKAGSKGGKAGQWSARKAQMLAKEYKAMPPIIKKGAQFLLTVAVASVFIWYTILTTTTTTT